MQWLKSQLSRLRRVDRYTITIWGWAAILVLSLVVCVTHLIHGVDLGAMITAFLAGQSLGGIFVTQLLKLMRERLVLMSSMGSTIDQQQQIIRDQQQLLRQAALAVAPEGKLQ